MLPVTRTVSGRRKWLLLLLAGLAASCASYSSVRFAPPIQEIELRDSGTEGRLSIAWRGVWARDDTYELCFRLRFESLGATTFELDAADFELLDGALAPFGPPRVEGLPVRIEPGGAATFALAFPPAEGWKLDAHDLSAVCLRVRYADGRWSSSTTFHRVEYYSYPYPYPYWGPPFHFHAGVLWCY